MSINFNFDAELIKKRMKSTHFGSQVVIASIIFSAGIICWFFLEFMFMNHTLVEHDYASLVETPFSFSLNEEVFAALASRREYTSATNPAEATLSAFSYELNDFPIFIIDEEASKRARSLVVINKNTFQQLTPTNPALADTITTPDFIAPTTTTTTDSSSDDVVEITTTN